MCGRRAGGCLLEGHAGGVCMQITFLGHAGLLVETAQALLLVDPWLSREGAFGSALMQFPRNHHLAATVRERVEASPKARFLCVSHEHPDRLDPAFLATLPRDLTVVLPAFRRPALSAQLGAQGFARVVTLEEGALLPLPGGSLRVFLDESGLAHDSALQVQADGLQLLALNGCALRPRLTRCVREAGPLDLLGARCAGRLESVGRALQALEPRLLVASDGPACFLDPKLFHLNSSESARAPLLAAQLDAQLRGLRTRRLEPMPGDVLELASGELGAQGTERVDGPRREAYLAAYAAGQADLYAARAREAARVDPQATLERLQDALEERLSALGVPERAPVPLYVSLEELPYRYLRVDFALQLVERVPYISDSQRHALSVAAADIAPVLDGALPWESLLLSFRMQLRSAPGAEDPLLQGFLALETPELGPFRAALSGARPEQSRSAG